MDTWGVADVVAWLHGVSAAAAAYGTSFAQQEIDGATLLSLSDRDLKDDLGVKELGVRRAILRAIERAAEASDCLHRRRGCAGYVSPPPPLPQPRHPVSAVECAVADLLHAESHTSVLRASRGSPSALPPTSHAVGGYDCIPLRPSGAAPPPHVQTHTDGLILSSTPVGDPQFALNVQCTGCARTAKLYPVLSRCPCRTCQCETEWRFVSSEAATPRV
eukprot:TRINITY_DN28190_c0_g1_i1.p1 TRINITY_DN28190_c0_g1~~TRINITY_DN28190_c0_g1_i1.p1  ORF type:complete len:233 (+),score=49.98 TRINITY_DN28190_c0_g1_i1:47-700(+)